MGEVVKLGLFGSKPQKTTTTSKPAPEVEALLKKIVSQTENEDLGEYIQHQFAEFTPDEKQSIQKLADSGQLRQASAALAPRMLQGLDQMASVNKQYGDLSNKGISADEILANKNTLQKGLYSRVQQNAATQGSSLASRLGGDSSAARAAARRGVSQQQAMNALNPNLTNASISLAQGQRSNKFDYANMRNNIAQGNIGLGQTGLDLGNQATQNQLAVGNMMQSYQNAKNQNTWQNQIGAAQFPFENTSRKLQVLDAVSPMAGYTTTNTAAAPSTASQIGGLALQGLSLYGKMGGFESGDASTQTGWLGTGANAVPITTMNNKLNNAAGTGLFNRMGWTYGGSK